MEDTSLLVSVIILGYNGRSFLEGCLGSVLDQELGRASYEVIYADNGSSDGSLDYVETSYPTVKCIDLGGNLGFAEGNNLAVEQATGCYLAFLNQDMIVHRDWLRSLVEAMRADPQLGVCHSNQIMPWHKAFAALERIESPQRVHVAELNRFVFVEFRELPMKSAPIRTRFMSGACFAIDREVLAQLEYLFDTRMYMYAEDLDLGLRVQALGYSVAVIPQAVAYHFHYGGSRWNFRRVSTALHAVRNRILAFYKTTPTGELLHVLPRLILGAPFNVFALGHNRLLQGMAFVGMLPIVVVGTLASVIMMPGYSQERAQLLQQRTATNALSSQPLAGNMNE